MEIIAKGLIIEYVAGQMIVLNAGDSGDLPEAAALEYIAGGLAEAETGSDLSALRARYEELHGKKPYMGWGAEQLKAKIEQIEADAAPADDDDGDAADNEAADGPPAV